MVEEENKAARCSGAAAAANKGEGILLKSLVVDRDVRARGKNRDESEAKSIYFLGLMIEPATLLTSK